MWIVGLESDETIQQIQARAHEPLPLAPPERIEEPVIQDGEEAQEISEEFYPSEETNGEDKPSEDGSDPGYEEIASAEEPPDLPEAMQEPKEDTSEQPICTEPPEPPEEMQEPKDETPDEPAPAESNYSAEGFRKEAEAVRTELGALGRGHLFCATIYELTGTALLNRVKPEHFRKVIDTLKDTLSKVKKEETDGNSRDRDQAPETEQLQPA